MGINILMLKLDFDFSVRDSEKIIEVMTEYHKGRHLLWGLKTKII